MEFIINEKLENLKLPEPTLVNFYKNLEDRIFWITEEIDEYTLELINYILLWNKRDEGIEVQDRKPIKLLFFSPGGDLNVNYSLIDIISLSKTPIIGINIGLCASAAAYIFLSCHKKYMLKNAFFLFHQGSGDFSGSYSEIYSHMQDYETQVKGLSQIIREHTDFSEEYITDNIVNEWYIRADDALKYKVVDGVVDDISLIYG